MSRLVGDDAVEAAASAIRAVFAKRAPGKASAPAVQPLAPYLNFMGEAYRHKLVPYGSEDGKDLCLRPDFTLAVALEIVEGRCEAKPVHYDTLVFRAARRSVSEASRHAPIQRQVGFELFGADKGPDQDAELILTALDAVSAAGQGAPRLVLSDMGLMCALIDSFDIHDNWKRRLKANVSNPTAFARTIEASLGQTRAPSALSLALSSVTRQESRAAVEEIFTMADMQAIGTRSLDDIADRLVTKAFEAKAALTEADAEILSVFDAVDGPLLFALDSLDNEIGKHGDGVSERLAHLREIGQRLEHGGVDLSDTRFDANLARGLNYYDGIIFELHSADGQTFLGGGGRYDALLPDLSGNRIMTGAVGAMLRPDRIIGSLEAE